MLKMRAVMRYRWPPHIRRGAPLASELLKRAYGDLDNEPRRRVDAPLAAGPGAAIPAT